jgi:predicted DCC family thiol-disulfide oxidoreductase YuxK
MGDSPVLLYDGLCGFCNATVQFVLPRDRTARLRFAPLQGEFAREVFARHPELAGVDSLILVETDDAGHERVSVRSESVLRLAPYLGGLWPAAFVLRIVPRAVRDWAYDRFASVRYRLFGRYDSCPLPTPEQRGRFLP